MLDRESRYHSTAVASKYPSRRLCVGGVAPIITLKHGAFDSSLVIWTISSLENPLEFRVRMSGAGLSSYPGASAFIMLSHHRMSGVAWTLMQPHLLYTWLHFRTQCPVPVCRVSSKTAAFSFSGFISLTGLYLCFTLRKRYSAQVAL